MTRTQLESITKSKKVNMADYMKVLSIIDDTYTWINIYLFDEQGVGSNRIRCNETHIRISVNAILKKEEEAPEEYETRKGMPQYIYELA